MTFCMLYHSACALCGLKTLPDASYVRFFVITIADSLPNSYIDFSTALRLRTYYILQIIDIYHSVSVPFVRAYLVLAVLC